MATVNAKNISSLASADLGLDGGGSQVALDADDERRKKLLQAQRERMGMTGSSVFGAASDSIFGGLGG